MKIGFLVIGSEILDGKITDLNTKALADFLRLQNVDLTLALTVRDQEDSIMNSLEILFKECDVVVTSGGLGPTLDDITKQTLAKFLGRVIAYSPDAEEVALKNYAKFDRPFPGKEHGYCYLPSGFVALNNSTGFAPNLFTQYLDKYLICGPGVPREFKSMLDDHMVPQILSKFRSLEVIESINIRTKKVPEEKIFNEVDKDLWAKLSAYGDVSSLPIFYGVDIGVKLRAHTEAELARKKAAVMKIIEDSPVNEHIWHIGRESLEEVIVKKTKEKNIKFGFAESCTGGLCSHRVTNVSGSSATFMGGVVSYDNSVKEALLEVDKETLRYYGAVSVETAQEMAQGLLKNLNLDLAISITGIAGPAGGSQEKPVGTVCIGVSMKGKTYGEKFKFFGDREQLKNRFSQAALMMLLENVESFA
jgi:nicotinamide-nucleotide amidase